MSGNADQPGAWRRLRIWFAGTPTDRPPQAWHAEPTVFQTPSKGDAYDFTVSVRCSWTDGRRSLAKVQEQATEYEHIVREDIAVATRCVLRAYPPHLADQAEAALNRRLHNLAEQPLPETSLRWAARVEVSLHPDVQELQQQAWTRQLEQAALHEFAGKIVKNYTEMTDNWWRLLASVGIAEPDDPIPPYLAPHLVRLAAEPQNAADIVDELARNREGKDKQLLDTVFDAVRSVENVDVNLLEFEAAHNSALIRLMHWVGLPIPGQLDPGFSWRHAVTRRGPAIGRASHWTAAWALAGAATTAAALGLTACDGGGRADGDGQPGTGAGRTVQSAAVACADRRVAPTSSDPVGTTVFLVDHSATARGVGAPDYVVDLDAEAKNAVNRGDTVLVAGFDGSAGTLAWTTLATDYVGDSTNRAFDQLKSLDCLVAQLTDAARTPARAPGTDVLGAMGAAAVELAKAPDENRRLVVATDGLVNLGCANLLDSPFADDVAPVVARCRDNELPDLTGTRVRMRGIGHSAADQPVPTSEQLTWLNSLWSALCAAATGDAAACTIESTAGRASVTHPGPVGADDETVVYPALIETQADGRVVLTFPDRMLFETASTELLPEASAAVASLVAKVGQVDGQVEQVIGHTDSRADVAYNDLLSLGRAQQVAGALRAAGVEVDEVVGAGERSPNPVCEPEYFPDGSENSEAMRCNRRVEVVIALGPGR